MLVDVAAVASGRLTTGRPMIATDGDEPVFTRFVLLLQDLGSDGEIAIRVEQVARVVVAMLLVAKIDLAKSGVNAAGRCLDKRPAQSCARCSPSGIALALAGDIERPRPWDQAATQARSTFLQCHCVQHRRWHTRLPRGELIGWGWHFQG